MKRLISFATLILLFLASHTVTAFEVTGESFQAEFDVTSVTSTKSGSVLTAEGDIEGYGRVFLTYNFEGVHGLGDLGTSQDKFARSRLMASCTEL